MKSLRFMVLPILLLSFSFSAGAVNLTGTWTGRFRCSGFDGINFSFVQPNRSQPPQSLRISQPPDGSRLSVQWLDGEELAATFTGFTIDSITRPTTRGHAAIADCATKADITSGVSEITDLNAVVNPNRGTGSLTGLSIYTDQTDDPNNPNDRPEVTRCRWIFRLADTADPGIPASCPPL
ncbi:MULTISPECIES: hypothetical protein [Methylomicrobium]|uniref:Uncharacterized protein n=2 Tax=Methylomicrobium album TaxID=39775 RepID=H8GPE4_METAL|nr:MULTISPECIES: hypothetical protein [Methylomicrobium]AAC45110.1 unknown [Methylomicrobium album BG8]EIC30890.1 hypothetical protein Metal_3219 [Methylomicrobium album BG8]